MHEYRLLRDLERLDSPSVEPVGVITDRLDKNGEPLDSILVTQHLQFSLPYRALFSSTLRPDTVNRLIDALVALIVRLHLLGFFWGDCSLSNTLFRRDAGAFAAYLVDAETGELHQDISDGQRAHDLYTAEINLFGELSDLRGRRPARRRHRPAGDGPVDHRAVRGALEGADRAGGVPHRRDAPAGLADPAAERTRLRRRRDRHHHRLGRQPGPDPAEGRGRRPPQPPAAPADRPRRRGEPGPPAAQRPRLVRRLDRPAERGRGDRRPPVADRRLRARRPLGPPRPEPQTRTRRGLPRGPRTPLVPLRTGRPRGRHHGSRPLLRRRRPSGETRRKARRHPRHRAAPSTPTSTKSPVRATSCGWAA